MAVSQKLLLVIRAEAQNAIKQMQQASKGMTGLQNKTKSATKSFQSFAIKAAAAFMAIKTIGRVLGGTIDAYKKQLEAETKLQAALKATGNQIGYSEEQLHSMALEMQNTTIYGDEMIINAQAVMTTFTKIGHEVFPQAVKGAADLSAMFGQDLQQSVIQLGVALNDPIAGVGRLKKIGMSFSETQKDQIKLFMEANDIMSAQAVILDEVAVEAGGVAEAMGKTDIGKMAQAQNKLSNTMEKMGAVLLPMVADGLADFSKWIEENEDGIIATFKGIAEAIGVVGGVVASLTTTSVDVIEDMVKTGMSNAIINGLRQGATVEAMSALLGGNMERAWEMVEQSGIVDAMRTRMAAGMDVGDIGEFYGMDEASLKQIAEHFGLITKEVENLNDAFKDGPGLDLPGAKKEEEDDDENDKRIAAMKEWEDMQKSSIEREIQRIEESASFYTEMYEGNAQKQIDIEKWKQEEIDTIREEYAEKERERQLENIEESMGLVSEYAGQITDMISNVYSNQEVDIDNAYKKQKRAIEKNIKDETKKEKALEKLDKQYEKEKATLKSKAFKTMKAAAIIEATINTAQAIVASLKEGGPTGIAFAVIAGALGIAQIAIIAGQSEPSFAEGGSFIASQPQSIRVGDNPTQREQITVTPLGADEGGGETVPINLTVNISDEAIIEAVKVNSRRGNLNVVDGRLV